jgi:hypothetical protein
MVDVPSDSASYGDKMWALHDWYLEALAQFGVKLYLYCDRGATVSCRWAGLLIDVSMFV